MRRHLLPVALVALYSTPVPAHTQEIGSFIYSHSLDDFTDEDHSTIATADEEASALLAWRCLADGLNVLLHAGRYMGGDADDDDDILVRYRFDKQDASDREYWRLFPGQNEIAYARMNRVDAITVEALGAETVVIETVDPLDSESRRFRMSLTGMRTALGKLPCASRFLQS